MACFSKLFVSCWQKCEFSSRSPQIESQQLMKIQRKQLREKHKFEMKWMFGKIPGLQGSFRDSGGVGNQGELYFLPASKPMLKAPLDSIGKEVVIPLFPRNQVLGPAGEDYLLIYEMRYRQLFNEIKEGGVCGQIFYSQENSKMALVGTLSKVTKLARLDDGSMYLTMQGIGRFYVREVTKEKPYLLAKVQIFNDYTENIHLVQSLERKVLDEVRYSIKLMKKLNPNINYSLNEGVIRYQPRDLLPQLVSDVSNNQQVIETDVKRNIYLDSDLTEVQRHSKFSYSILEMIKTDAITKLVFVQEAILEKRYSKMLKVSLSPCMI